jgi:hypothetical protein
MNAPKSLFSTKIAAGAALTLFGSILFGITPVAKNYFVRHAESIEAKQDIEDIAAGISIVLGVLGCSGSAIALRGGYEEAPNSYTPRWMAGRNPEDIQPAEESS